MLANHQVSQDSLIQINRKGDIMRVDNHLPRQFHQDSKVDQLISLKLLEVGLEDRTTIKDKDSEETTSMAEREQQKTKEVVLLWCD